MKSGTRSMAAIFRCTCSGWPERKLRNEHVGFGRREVHGECLATVLDHGAAGEAFRRRGALAVVLQNVEGDLLASADKFDRMSFHDDDDAAVVAFLQALGGGAERNDGKERCDGYALEHAGFPLALG